MKKFEVFIRKSIDEALEEATLHRLDAMAGDLEVDTSTAIIKEIKKALKQATDDEVIEFYKKYSIDC